MRHCLLTILAVGLAWSACSADRDLPASYRRVEVPESRLKSDGALRNGERLYLGNCALCHGISRDGHGLRRSSFSRPPRNFADDAWQRSTSARRIFFTIREGIHATAMPAWPDFTTEQTWDLVAYVRSTPSGNRQLVEENRLQR
jgi:mono/diheme cytochrome c family protein